MQDAGHTGWTVGGILFVLLIVCLLVGWGASIAIWGYPAIIMPALGLTLTGLITLVFVTRG